MAMKNKYLDEIKLFGLKADKFLAKSEVSYQVSKEIVYLYQALCAQLICDDNVDENIKEYLLDPQKTKLKPQYSPLSKYKKVQNHILKSYKSSIDKALKSKDHDKVYTLISEAVELDCANVVLIEKIEKNFLDNELYNDLTKLYKQMFIYSVNPKYFLKLADLYDRMENYKEAIDYYLSYCESSNPNPSVYYKLAQVFKKNNEPESELSCIEFAKKLEAESGL